MGQGASTERVPYEVLVGDRFAHDDDLHLGVGADHDTLRVDVDATQRVVEHFEMGLMTGED
jgi:hypothetical protein